MRQTIVILCLGLAAAAPAGDTTQEKSAGAATPDERFSYTVLEDDPRQSSITASGDTARFRLYYVDMECAPYRYHLEQPDDSTLRVIRFTEDPEGCDREIDALYGVSGRIAGLTPRKYLLELVARRGDVEEVLFHDVVRVPARTD